MTTWQVVSVHGSLLINLWIQALSSSTLGVVSKTSSPSIAMEGMGTSLPRAFENSQNLLAPPKILGHHLIPGQDILKFRCNRLDHTGHIDTGDSVLAFVKYL